MKKMKWFAGMLAFAGAGALVQASELSERKTIADEAKQAMWQGDFETLNRLWVKYSDPKEKTASGSPKMRFFEAGIDEVLDRKGVGEDYRKEGDAVTRRWLEEHPNAALAHILRAKGLIAYAWYFRGGAWAYQVKPEAWPKFEAKVQEAAEVLAKSAGVAGGDAGWYEALLEVGRALGWSTDVLGRFTDEGLKQHPEDMRIYTQSMVYLRPRWGGSVQAIDAFIKRAAQVVPEGQGVELYARLYDSYGGWEDEGRVYPLYSDKTLVDWPTMKKGLGEWTQRYPTSWNRNVAAFQACMAKDKEMAADLMREMVPGEDMAVWDRPGSNAFEGCKKWALGD
jgi:hypothetical protein